MLCYLCRWFKGLTNAGKAICVKRGTKRVRAKKCVKFEGV